MTELTATTPGGLVLDNLIWCPTGFIRFVGTRVGGAPVVDGVPQLRSLEDFDVYQAAKLVLEGVGLEGSEYYDRACRTIAAGGTVHHCAKSPAKWIEIETRIFRNLIESMKVNGYQPGRGQYPMDEIVVQIDEHGHMIKDACGGHRFSVAKLLGIPRVLIAIRERHPKWIAYLDQMQQVATEANVGLYELVPHPDLSRIKRQFPMSRAERIVAAVGYGNRTMIDIGANYGQMCHAFESAGYVCTAVEKDREIGSVLTKFRDALYRKFEVLPINAMDLPEIRADVVVCMNVFRHLVAQSGFAAFDTWLDRVHAKVLVMSMPRWPTETRYLLKEWTGTDLEFTEYVAGRLGKKIESTFDDGPAGRSRRGFILR